MNIANFYIFHTRFVRNANAVDTDAPDPFKNCQIYNIRKNRTDWTLKAQIDKVGPTVILRGSFIK